MVLLQFETDKTKEKTVDGQMKMKILTHPFCVSHSEPHGAEPRNRESSGKVGERLLRENLGKASRARIRSDAMLCDVLSLSVCWWPAVWLLWWCWALLRSKRGQQQQHRAYHKHSKRNVARASVGAAASWSHVWVDRPVSQYLDATLFESGCYIAWERMRLWGWVLVVVGCLHTLLYF